MPSSDARAYAPEQVLEITRTFDAPGALVWRLWSAPEHRLRWWGPEGMALSELEIDFREGGAWRMVMTHVSGDFRAVHGTFREIREPSRLSFTYINHTDQHEMLVELDFIDLGTKTEMRFRQSPFITIEERDAHRWGWGSTLDLLSDYVRRVSRVEPQPVGRPRIDGVAADMIAARERYELERRGERGDKTQ